MKRLCTVIPTAGAVLAGCTAPADLDGEVGGPAGATLGPAPTAAPGRGTAVGDARALPAAWRAAAAAGSGLTPVAGSVSPAPEPAPQLIADTARRVRDLVVVALGPMTNLADLATQHADDYARLGAVQAMGGSVAGPVVDGVAEWNAAADPESFATVLAAAVPLTIVPEDAIPLGDAGRP